MIPTSRDWRLVAALSLLLLLTTVLPYMYHASRPAAGETYTGLQRYVNDQISYLMWTNQVRRGDLAVTNLYSIDGTDRFAPNPLWALVGLVGRVVPVSTVVLYHAARVLFGLVYLFVLFGFLARFCPDRFTTWLAWLLTVTASGAGSLYWLGSREGTLAGMRVSADFMPELWTYSSLLYFPHFVVSLLLMVASFAALVDSWKAERMPLSGALAAGLLLGVLAVVHTYTAVTAVAVLLLHSLCLTVLRVPWKRVVTSNAVALITSAPFFAFQLWETKSHVSLSRWAASNLMPSPSPLSYLCGFGLVGILGILGFLRTARWLYASRSAGEKQETQEASTRVFEVACRALLLSWVVATVVLIFSRVSFERRCVEGLHIPLVLLAVSVLAPSLVQLGRRRVLAAGLFILLCAPTSLWYVAREFPSRTGYIASGILGAEEAIAERFGPGARAFAVGGVGQWLPIEGRVRVWTGHGQLTPNHGERDRVVERFFSRDLSDEQRRQLLADTGCQVVVAFGSQIHLLEKAPELWQEQYRDGPVALFSPRRVSGAASPQKP